MTLAEFLLARTAEDEVSAGKMVNNGPGNSPTARRERGMGVRMLAEVDAKRLIVAMFQELDEGDGGFFFGVEASMLRLATVYASHPDYDQAWKP